MDIYDLKDEGCGVPVTFAGYKKPVTPKSTGMGSATLPSSFIIDTVLPYTDLDCIVTCFQNKPGAYKQTWYIPKDTQVEPVTGEEKERILKEVNDAIKSDMSRYFMPNFGRTLVMAKNSFFMEKNGEIVPANKFLGSANDPFVPDLEEVEKKVKNKAAAPAYNAYNDPYATAGYGTYERAFHDGVLACFSAKEGEGCLAYVVDSIQRCLKIIYKSAQKLDKDITFSSRTLLSVDTDWNTVVPSNIYGLAPTGSSGVIYTSCHPLFHNFRVTARIREEVIKALDAIIGLCCVCMFEGLENPERRLYTGLPGDYREHGSMVRWAFLSNAVYFHPTLFNVVMDTLRMAAAFAYAGLFRFWECSTEETIDIIMSNDVKRAKEVLEKNKGIMLCLLEKCYTKTNNRHETALKFLSQSLYDSLETPKDIVNNWLLNDVWISHGENDGRNWARSYLVIQKGAKI